LLEELSVLFGGIEAERLLLDDITTGAAGSDLVRATHLARMMVEYGGMNLRTGLRQYSFSHDGHLRRDPEMSEQQRGILDEEVNNFITEAQHRAATILKDNRVILETLRDTLLEKKTIDAKALKEMTGVEKKVEEAPKKGKKSKE
jgi:cell division protease FtsH